MAPRIPASYFGHFNIFLQAFFLVLLFSDVVRELEVVTKFQRYDYWFQEFYTRSQTSLFSALKILFGFIGSGLVSFEFVLVFYLESDFFLEFILLALRTAVDIWYIYMYKEINSEPETFFYILVLGGYIPISLDGLKLLWSYLITKKQFI
ncbi:MAG: hypothetical protein EZS28_047430 [Streblomastix strix]|uniref:Uncharacterized protein n=1 Tax=Streblomastix strix TaxID=222440 RepID=A0A5J4TGL9_9EUKA|nr:MAG: hypothetical protein EZS28_047430 [Streblomastix strix]